MRLIDADELVRDIDELVKDAGFYRPIYEGVKNGINAQQTIDAVPVVRCKDCKNAKRHEIFPHSRRCSIEDYRFSHKEMHFCSYGERKDGVS